MSFFASVGLGTRGALAIATALSLLSILFRTTVKESLDGWNRPFEAVVGYLVSRAWTYITAGFVETNPILLLFCLGGLLLAGRYFERVWGTRELAKFIFLVNTLSTVLSTVTVFFEFVASQQNEDLLYKTYIGGMLGLLSAFLVGFKQAIPEHSLNLMGSAVSIRVKNLPSIAFVSFLVLLIFRVVHVDAFMVFYGITVSWIYIRFFKYHDGIRGDRSESFSFGSFFPASTHRIIVPISNSTFNLLVSLNLLPKLAPVTLPQSSQDVSAEPHLRSYSPKPLPGSDAAEAERRRALALKSLDMRLKEGSGLAVPTGGAVVAGGSPGLSRDASRPATPARFGAVEASPVAGGKESGSDE
ncbi:eukaryotic integral membrane protein-domain-containing protein [Obelidium mucronatum]|nr:eukaryotic integral membrane protein-domain-containing protein [Obelidium mucronatum]